jgi:hypothetical protein
MGSTKAVFFISFLLTAVSAAAGLAHLFELPNKIKLSAGDYLAVQQIYRGWAFLGIAVVGSLVSNLVLAILVRRVPKAFSWALTAFLCIAGAQIIFWVFTYPVNLKTQNWTVLPQNWLQLRSRWEYSHASGAVLDLVALCSLFAAAVIHSRRRV